MAQRQHSLRKIQTPDLGMVVVAGSFPADPAAVLLDGYQALPGEDSPNDGSGAGYKGILRVGTGVFRIVLDRVYPELLHACGSVFTATSTSVSVQFDSDMMSTVDPDTGEDVSVIELRVVGALGVDTALVSGDRISFHLCLRNSSV